MDKLTDEELDKKIEETSGYEKADLIREKVRRQGYKIIDTPEGPVIERI